MIDNLYAISQKNTTMVASFSTTASSKGSKRSMSVKKPSAATSAKKKSLKLNTTCVSRDTSFKDLQSHKYMPEIE